MRGASSSTRRCRRGALMSQCAAPDGVSFLSISFCRALVYIAGGATLDLGPTPFI